VIGGPAQLLEEPFEAAGRHPEHVGGLLDLVGVHQPGRHVPEVTGAQAARLLGAVAVGMNTRALPSTT
jgi:hypothetical protein